MPESQSFSIGVDRLLQQIRPYNKDKKESCFPCGLDDAQSRRKADECLHQWFKRMVDRFCDGKPKLVSLEENLAVFVHLGWKKKQLLYANIQTIYATCDLEKYYLSNEDVEGKAIYLRLDFDYKTLGDPFSHPLAHIHVEGDLSPRFALEGGNSGNIIVDYLEFLYRNYVPQKWLQWVKRVWVKEFAKSATEGDTDPLPIIVRAFETSQFQILRDYSTQIERIKQTLRREKDKFFSHGMVGLDRIILEYPIAR